MTKSRILMKIPRKVDMINDCIRPWSSIRVSKSLTILRSKKVMGKLMVLRRKSLTIPMLIRSDTYSIRRLWIKSDAIELNAKIIPAISMVFTNWILPDPMPKSTMDWDMKGESSPINIPATIPTISCEIRESFLIS